MNPKFFTAYKYVRLLLSFLADFIVLIILVFILSKIGPKDFRRFTKKLKPSWLSFKNPNFVKGTLFLIFFFFILSTLLVKTMIFPTLKIYSATKKVMNSSREAINLLKTQNFSESEKKLTSAKDEIEMAKDLLENLSWIEKVPLAKNYYYDIKSLFAASEYALDSGLVATKILLTLNSTSLTKIEDISPLVDQISTDFALARGQIDEINPDRYPKNIVGKPIREKIIQTKQQIDEIENIRLEYQPIVKMLPDLIGLDSTKHYLVLFQDDNKIKPTGGTITAFGIFQIEKGKITPQGSGGINELDNSLEEANISADFPTSMRNFERIYQNSYLRAPIDGIIAIDGEFFVNLLQALGPTIVYKNVLSSENKYECNCPSIIDDIQSVISQNRQKDIIGVFLNAILVKTLSSPIKTQMDVFLAVVKSAQEKHLLLYLSDADQQKMVETTDIAGQLSDAPGDFLHINEANFSSSREDRYIKRRVDDRTKFNESNEILKTISLTYRKNSPATQSSSLVVRFYVPKGSQLIRADGGKQDISLSEGLGKTVFETSLEISPQIEKDITIQYRLPFKIDLGEGYKLIRQKQAGAKSYEYLLFLDGEKVKDFYLEGNQEFSLTEP